MAETGGTGRCWPQPQSDAAGAGVGLIGASRLEALAALQRGGRFHDVHGPAGRWFAHRILGLETNIGSAVLTLADGADRDLAIEHFMAECRLDIARLTVVGGVDGDPARPSGLWSLGTVSEARELMWTGPDTDTFLTRLGSHTRRNIRRTVRIADELGIQFEFHTGEAVPGIGEAELALAACNQPAPLSASRLRAYEALGQGKPGRFEARLRLPTGELISYCCGYVADEAGHLVCQLNHPVVPQINLSLLLRYRLIERLIGLGVPALVFTFGCAGLLHASCEPVPVAVRLVIRPSWRGIVTALATALCLPTTRTARTVWQIMGAGIGRKLARSRSGHAAAEFVLRGFRRLGGERPAPAGKYGFALLITLGAIGLRMAMSDFIQELPGLTMYPAIAAVSVRAGPRAGALAMLMGGVGVWGLLLSPYHASYPGAASDAYGVFCYFLRSFPCWWLVSAIVELNRKTNLW